MGKNLFFFILGTAITCTCMSQIQATIIVTSDTSDTSDTSATTKNYSGIYLGHGAQCWTDEGGLCSNYGGIWVGKFSYCLSTSLIDPTPTTTLKPSPTTTIAILLYCYIGSIAVLL